MLHKDGSAPLFMTLLLCVFITSASFAITIPQCDSLIRIGIEAMHRNNHVKSMELLTKARAIAEKNRWYKQEFLAINNIGANYYSLLEYGEALNYYLEAYTIALKQLEPKHEMIVLNNIAILYSKEQKHNKANEYFLKAYKIAEENNDRLKMGLYATNLGNVASETNKPPLARKYFEQAVSLLKENPQLLILAKLGLADCDLAEGKTREARNAAEQLYKITANRDFNDVGISLLTVIAKSYLTEGNFPMAISYCNKMLALKPNLDTKVNLFNMLSEASLKTRSYEDAVAFKDSVIRTNAAIESVKNGKLFENSRVKFEIQNYQNEIALKESVMANERKIFYSILTIIVIIVVFVILSLRNISVKHKQKKLIAERSEQILALELEKEKSDSLLLEKQFAEKETITLLEQERLKNELESRNRKLSAKALYLSGRNQLIEEVLADLSTLPQLSNDESVSKHIEKLKNHLHAGNEWDNFITHFEEVNHGFLQALKAKHPNLTANDIRFISYIYMNLSTKEIASMLNITTESCRKRKERISTKLELSNDINLYDYLATI